jgi:hypothetical protein
MGKIGLPGPKTIEGKIAVRGNAITHGLFQQRVSLPAEEIVAFQTHLLAIMDDLQPVGYLEREIVAEIAWFIFKRVDLARYRIAVAEVQLLRREKAALIPAMEWPPPVRLFPALASLPEGKAEEKVIRQEAHLSRQLDRAFNRLYTLQDRRRNSAGPATEVFIAVETDENYKTNSTGGSEEFR